MPLQRLQRVLDSVNDKTGSGISTSVFFFVSSHARRLRFSIKYRNCSFFEVRAKKKKRAAVLLSTQQQQEQQEQQFFASSHNNNSFTTTAPTAPATATDSSDDEDDEERRCARGGGRGSLLTCGDVEENPGPSQHDEEHKREQEQRKKHQQFFNRVDWLGNGARTPSATRPVVRKGDLFSITLEVNSLPGTLHALPPTVVTAQLQIGAHFSRDEEDNDSPRVKFLRQRYTKLLKLREISNRHAPMCERFFAKLIFDAGNDPIAAQLPTEIVVPFDCTESESPILGTKVTVLEFATVGAAGTGRVLAVGADRLPIAVVANAAAAAAAAAGGGDDAAPQQAEGAVPVAIAAAATAAAGGVAAADAAANGEARPCAVVPRWRAVPADQFVHGQLDSHEIPTERCGTSNADSLVTSAPHKPRKIFRRGG